MLRYIISSTFFFKTWIIQPFHHFFHLQDEKNQVLMTNAWLQLVSDHPEVAPCIYSKFWVANVSLLLDTVRSRKSLCYVLGLTDLCICLCQYWTDIYLTWNPDIYPGVQNLRFPSDQVWTPDILLYNRSELFPRSCSMWLTLAYQLVCFGEGLESVWTSVTFLQNDLLSWDVLEAVQSYRR